MLQKPLSANEMNQTQSQPWLHFPCSSKCPLNFSECYKSLLLVCFSLFIFQSTLKEVLLDISSKISTFISCHQFFHYCFITTYITPSDITFCLTLSLITLVVAELNGSDLHCVIECIIQTMHIHYRVPIIQNLNPVSPIFRLI